MKTWNLIQHNPTTGLVFILWTRYCFILYYSLHNFLGMHHNRDQKNKIKSFSSMLTLPLSLCHYHASPVLICLPFCRKRHHLTITLFRAFNMFLLSDLLWKGCSFGCPFCFRLPQEITPSSKRGVKDTSSKAYSAEVSSEQLILILPSYSV